MIQNSVLLIPFDHNDDPSSFVYFIFIYERVAYYIIPVTLTMATKWRRFMPGLLALVSANLSKEEILNPAAFPA